MFRPTRTPSHRSRLGNAGANVIARRTLRQYNDDMEMNPDIEQNVSNESVFVESYVTDIARMLEPVTYNSNKNSIIRRCVAGNNKLTNNNKLNNNKSTDDNELFRIKAEMFCMEGQLQKLQQEKSNIEKEAENTILRADMLSRKLREKELEIQQIKEEVQQAIREVSRAKEEAETDAIIAVLTNRVENIKINKEKEPRVDECIICCENKKESVFVPCGHSCTCLSCGSKIKKCPVCRKRYKSVIKLYLS